MPSPAPHPLEARFVKLAILNRMLTPSQVQRCQQLWLKRLHADAATITLEQIFLEEGLLTDDECNHLWAVITQPGELAGRDRSQETTHPGTAPASASGSRLAQPALPASPETTVAAEPSLVIQGYEIRSLIGRGGMGSVYRARQVAMDRDVALKLLPPDLASDAKYIRRFFREARAAGMLNHGNLVGVYDVGECEGRYYISMEYVEGRTVKQIMRREGRIPVADCLKIIEQVAAALECAHRSKIVHRDIKPDNIMLTPQGIAKLCDLGLAKVLEGGPLQDSDTQEGHTMGTPHYMSPEQARAAGKVTARSDLYSLGATLYHMLTGRVPFDGETPLEVLIKVMNEEPVPVDRLEPLLPPPLGRLVQRLLAKIPEERPLHAAAVQQEIAQLRRDIEHGRIFVLNDAPRISARRPLPYPKTHRSKMPWAWAGAGALSACVLGVLWARTEQAHSAAPTPDFPDFETAADSDPSTNTAPPAPAVSEAPPPPPATIEPSVHPVLTWSALEPWERRLAIDPQSWREADAALRSVSEQLLTLSPEDLARCNALQAGVARLKEAEASRVAERTRAGARALAEAGAFRRAVGLWDALLAAPLNVPLGLNRPALDASRELLTRERATAELRARRAGELSQAGLGELVQAELERWRQEMDEDRVPLKDPLRGLLEDATRQLERERAQQSAAETVSDNALANARNGLARIRERSSQHDLEGALERCRAELQAAETPAELAAYGVEESRLRLIQKLFARLSSAIGDHSGQLRERDFRPHAHPETRVTEFTSDRMVTEASNGKASLKLSSVTRDEMRALFHLVLEQEHWADNDRLGRLAYDLEDATAPAARAALAALAAQDPGAQELLKLHQNAEAFMLQKWVRNHLLQAERVLVSAETSGGSEAYPQVQRLTGEALALINPGEFPPLEEKAQALLREAARARAAAGPLGGSVVLLDHDRLRADYPARLLSAPGREWSWRGAIPELRPQGDLAFGAEDSLCNATFTLNGPAVWTVEFSFDPQSRGRLTLYALATGPASDGSSPGRWKLEVVSDGESVTAALGNGRAAEPRWARVALAPGLRHRLWLDLNVGTVGWGDGETRQETRPAPAQASWRVGMAGQGEVRVYGVRVEGAVLTNPTSQAWAEEARQALGQALAEPENRRGAALREVLAAYGGLARVASGACAGLAGLARKDGREAETRYWEHRALFECPVADRPPEVQAMEADHLRWASFRERLGLPPAERLRLDPGQEKLYPVEGAAGPSPGGSIGSPGAIAAGVGVPEEIGGDRTQRQGEIVGEGRGRIRSGGGASPASGDAREPRRPGSGAPGGRGDPQASTPLNEGMFVLISELMRMPVISISPEAGLDRALVMMRTQRIRHLPVVENGELVGIVSDRDLRMSMQEMQGPQTAPKGLYLPALTKVRSAMKHPVIFVNPDDPIQRAAQLMTENKIGALPVVQAHSRILIGIVTETDMLRLLTKMLNQESGTS